MTELPDQCQNMKPIPQGTHRKLLRHLAANASLETLCRLDIDLDYTPELGEPAQFMLSVLRAAMTSLVASRCGNDGLDDTIQNAINFLPYDGEYDPTISLLLLSLKAQTSDNPGQQFIKLLDHLDEINFHYSAELIAALPNREATPPSLKSGEVAVSFQRNDIESTTFQGQWEYLKKISSPENPWKFWMSWQAAFFGEAPLDWELQRRVALIPDEDWQKGPEHIARLIEEIRTRFELEKRLEELEAEKHLWQERARLGIGGNNPPEAIEDARIVQEIIWAPIEELKAETQSDAPDKSRIKSAISKLGAALIAIGKWPLGKLDKAADEFAKSLGKWGGGACAGWLALKSDKIAEIIKAAQDWLGTLF